jgi:hypothetical protein
MLNTIITLLSKIVTDAHFRPDAANDDDGREIIIAIRDKSRVVEQSHALFAIKVLRDKANLFSSHTNIKLTNLLDEGNIKAILVNNGGVSIIRPREGVLVTETASQEEMELLGGMLHVCEILHGQDRETALKILQTKDIASPLSTN